MGHSHFVFALREMLHALRFVQADGFRVLFLHLFVGAVVPSRPPWTCPLDAPQISGFFSHLLYENTANERRLLPKGRLGLDFR